MPKGGLVSQNIVSAPKKLSDAAALGLRYEYFSSTDASNAATNVNAVTFSANIGSGPLVFIPELRFDAASENIFIDSDANPTSSAVQAVLAAVFSF